MRVSIIVAQAENAVIGLNNTLPWHLSADLQRFKQITMGKPIIMGRKTHESIGRPLPGRDNVVISRNRDYCANGCFAFTSLSAALAAYTEAEEVFIIGGAGLYADALDKAEYIYLTQIHQTFTGDTFFPALPKALWQEVKKETIDDDDSVSFSYSFIEIQRRSLD